MSKVYAKWIDYDINTLAADGTTLKVKTDSPLPITASLSVNANTASYVNSSSVDGITDYVRNDQTSSMTVLSSSFAITASYVDFNNVDNVPDFVLESETSSMSVESASFAITASYIDYSNIDNTPFIPLSGSELFNDSNVSGSTVTDALNSLSSSLYSLSSSVQDLTTEVENLSSSVQDIINGNITVTSSSFSSTASYVDFVNIDNLPTLISGSEQVIHNLTNGLQGGTAPNEYYHLNASEHANLTSGSPVFNNLTINNTASFLGNVDIDGTLTVNELIVTEFTRSVLYSSGSTKFGDTLDDTHVFTGSVSITGSSFTYNGNQVLTSNDLSSLFVQEMFEITTPVSTSGFFTLSSTPTDAQSVRITPVGGPMQVNSASIGLTGVTPDFWVNGNLVYFNNNGVASGLSGDADTGCVLIAEYNVSI